MPEAILRLTLTRGPGGRGYTPSGESKPTVVMTTHPAPPSEKPVAWNLVTSSFRIAAADPLAAFKTTSKILHIMARAEAVEKGADEALLLNTDGEVAETASGNLFWVFDGRTAPCRPGMAFCRASRARQSWKFAGRLACRSASVWSNRNRCTRLRAFSSRKASSASCRWQPSMRAARAVAGGGSNLARLPRNAGPR